MVTVIGQETNWLDLLIFKIGGKMSRAIIKR